MALTRDEIYNSVRDAVVGAIGVSEEEVTPEASLLGDLGAELHTDAPVEEVIVRGGRAAGVRTAAGEFQARRAVICCVTPQQLYLKLLDRAVLVSVGSLEQAQSQTVASGDHFLVIAVTPEELPETADSKRVVFLVIGAAGAGHG